MNLKERIFSLKYLPKSLSRAIVVDEKESYTSRTSTARLYADSISIRTDEQEDERFEESLHELQEEDMDPCDLPIGWFEVIREGGVILRSGPSLRSEWVGRLPKGAYIYIYGKRGNRVIVQEPLVGWITQMTHQGEPYITKIADTIEELEAITEIQKERLNDDELISNTVANQSQNDYRPEDNEFSLRADRFGYKDNNVHSCVSSINSTWSAPAGPNDQTQDFRKYKDQDEEEESISLQESDNDTSTHSDQTKRSPSKSKRKIKSPMAIAAEAKFRELDPQPTFNVLQEDTKGCMASDSDTDYEDEITIDTRKKSLQFLHDKSKGSRCSSALSCSNIFYDLAAERTKTPEIDFAAMSFVNIHEDKASRTSSRQSKNKNKKSVSYGQSIIRSITPSAMFRTLTKLPSMVLIKASSSNKNLKETHKKKFSSFSGFQLDLTTTNVDSLESQKSFFVKSSGIIFVGDQEEIPNVRKDTLNQMEVAYHGKDVTIYRVHHIPTNTKKALKSIKVTERNSRREICAEWHILKTIRHPNIVELHDVSYDAENKQINLLLEWMDQGSLWDYIRYHGPMKKDIMRSISKDILRGLKYLKHKEIIHNDIKTANILLNNNIAKIADFGISQRGGDRNCLHLSGTHIYMSPERLNGKEYSYPSDIWAFGLCVCEMAEGIPYFSPKIRMPQLVVAACYSGDLKMKENTIVKSNKLKLFIESMLKTEEGERETAEELLKTKFIRKRSRKCLIM